MQNVSVGKRLSYSLIDIALYTAATLTLASQFGWSPQIEFMGNYTSEQREEYWSMLWLALGVVSLGSIVTHAVYGKSIGKWIARARSVNLDGSALGFGGAIRRWLYMVALNALIFLPGPIIGFWFGQNSEVFSSLALMAGLFLVPALALVPTGDDGVPLLQRKFGVRTVNDG